MLGSISILKASVKTSLNRVGISCQEEFTKSMHSQFAMVSELINVSLATVIIIKMQGLSFVILNAFINY